MTYEGSYYYYSTINNSRCQLYNNLTAQYRTRYEAYFNDDLDSTKKCRKYQCEVRIFNDVVQIYEFNANYCGSDLISKICRDLNIVEKHYFGLQYCRGNKRWLKAEENIAKALKGINHIVFIFMFQFYPTNTKCLEDYMTMYYLTIQLKNDMRNKKIECTLSESVPLSAKLFHAHHGPYDREQFRLIHFGRDNLIWPEIMEDKVMRRQFINEYRSLGSLTFLQADQLFLEHVLRLPDYGEERYHAKTLKLQQMKIGISPIGIRVYKEKVTVYPWKDFMGCYEMFGNLVIQYANQMGQRESKLFSTSDNGFLIDLIRRNETAYKMLSMKKTPNCINIDLKIQLEPESDDERPPTLPRRFPESNADINNLPAIDTPIAYPDSFASSHKFSIGSSYQEVDKTTIDSWDQSDITSSGDGYYHRSQDKVSLRRKISDKSDNLSGGTLSTEEIDDFTINERSRADLKIQLESESDDERPPTLPRRFPESNTVINNLYAIDTPIAYPDSFASSHKLSIGSSYQEVDKTTIDSWDQSDITSSGDGYYHRSQDKVSLRRKISDKSDNSSGGTLENEEINDFPTDQRSCANVEDPEEDFGNDVNQPIKDMNEANNFNFGFFDDVYTYMDFDGESVYEKLPLEMSAKSRNSSLPTYSSPAVSVKNECYVRHNSVISSVIENPFISPYRFDTLRDLEFQTKTKKSKLSLWKWIKNVNKLLKPKNVIKVSVEDCYE